MLFHTHFSNYQDVSQHTSGLDCIGFFINGNVLSSLALIFFFCYVVSLHYISNLRCCLLKNVCSGLETLLCAVINMLPKKQKDKNTLSKFGDLSSSGQCPKYSNKRSYWGLLWKSIPSAPTYVLRFISFGMAVSKGFCYRFPTEHLH